MHGQVNDIFLADKTRAIDWNRDLNPRLKAKPNERKKERNEKEKKVIA